MILTYRSESGVKFQIPSSKGFLPLKQEWMDGTVGAFIRYLQEERILEVKKRNRLQICMVFDEVPASVAVPLPSPDSTGSDDHSETNDQIESPSPRPPSRSTAP